MKLSKKQKRMIAVSIVLITLVLVILSIPKAKKSTSTFGCTNITEYLYFGEYIYDTEKQGFDLSDICGEAIYNNKVIPDFCKGISQYRIIGIRDNFNDCYELRAHGVVMKNICTMVKPIKHPVYLAIGREKTFCAESRPFPVGY